MNPNLKQNLQINLRFIKKFFYIGEPIEGHLTLISERPSIIEKILVEIHCFQSWKFNSKQSLSIKDKIETIELDLSHAPSLSQVQGCYVMPGGENIIPFKLKISENICPCFEYPLGDIYGYLRYSFDIQIYSTSFNNTFSRFCLPLYSRPSIDNKNKLLSKSTTKTLKKWGLFGIGTTILTVSIPDNNFKYNDNNFKAIIYVDNSNGRANTHEIKVKLIRLIQFLNQQKQIIYKEENVISAITLPARVEPRQKNYFECLLSLKENNTNRYQYNKNNICPYELKMPDINFFMPSLNSSYILCKYELNISLNFECHVSESSLPNISFPIYLVHQSTIEYLLELQKNKIENKFENKQTNEINNIINIDNKNNINNNNLINNDLNNELINQIDTPFFQNNNNDIVNMNNNEQNENLISTDNNIIEDDKFLTNDGNNSLIIDNNNGNNINCNFNNNTNINKINNNVNEDGVKNIKESTFNLLDDNNNNDNIYPDF